MRKEKPLTLNERVELGERLIALICNGHVRGKQNGPITEYTGIAADGTEVSLGSTFTVSDSKIDGRGLLNYLRACPSPEKW